MLRNHRPACVALAAVLFAWACGPRNYVALLKDPDDGTTGRVTVTNEQGSQVLSSSGDTTSIDDPTRPPTRPWQIATDKLQDVFGAVFAARAPRPLQTTLYFEHATTELTPESWPLLDELLDAARRNPAADADIEGHADRSDAASRNSKLAWMRADAVRQALIRAGVDARRIRISTRGEAKPAVPTADGVREPRNRRVEVTLR